MLSPPKFYGDPAFTVAEAAGIIGVPSKTLHNMLAHGGRDFVGCMRRGAIMLAAHEVYVIAVAAALIAYGFKTADAFAVADCLGGRHEWSPPVEGAVAWISKPDRGDEFTVMMANAGDVPTAPLVAMPLAEIWQEAMAKCAAEAA